MRLLVIEDQLLMRNALVEYFQQSGFWVDAYSTGDEGLWAASEHTYEVILLDLMLPNLNGMEIIRKLRAQSNLVNILVISARDGLDDRIEALDAGADDFLVKPFALAEALARVNVLIRRSHQKMSSMLSLDDLTLDTKSQEVHRAGDRIYLTAQEYRLLEYLIYRQGEVVSRRDIWDNVFEDRTGGNSNTVDVYIGYLRKKINHGGRANLIQTRRGLGYQLCKEV